jgi:threonine/homoserine/homoserine lactone efflux protein
MVTSDRLLAFMAASIVILVIPGPSVLFVVGRALAHGRRTALLSVLGNEIGEFALVLAVALGLGPLVEHSIVVFTAMKLAGAVYLVYLGVRAFRGRHQAAEFEAAAASGQTLRSLRDGFLVGVANPKAAIFFAAVLPQFVSRSAGNVTSQLVFLGLVYTALAFVTDSFFGLGASAARSWFASSPKRLAAVGGAGGLAMIGLGVGVAVTGRKD